MGNNKTNSQETPFHAGDDLTFRLMFESHSAIMLLIEPQSGVILDANPAALKFYGYPKLNGMLISDIDISPSEEGVLDQQKALSKPQTHFVFRQRLSNGAERRVEVDSSLLTVLGRQVLFLIIHDLTRLDPIQVGQDKKDRVLSDDEIMQDELVQENLGIYSVELERQNNELRRSQVQLEGLRARYFNLYNLAPMGYVTLSEHGLILEANLSAAVLLGESREALVNQSFSRFMLKGDADIFNLRCKALFETGAAQVYDLRLLKIDSPQGSAWVQLDLTFVQEADAKPICCVTLCDISERKQAEEALRESEEKYRLIGENTSDGIILFEANHRILYVSPAYLKQLGYSEAEELSRTPDMIKSIIHPDDGDVVFSKIFEAIRLNKSGLTYSYRIKHTAGHYIWREDNATFKYDDSGNYRGAYVICRDVTTRKLEETQRERLLVFATALNEIAQVIISEDNSENILEMSNRIIGETLQLDRALIYDVSFEKNSITGLCEWLKQAHPDIAPTKSVYPLEMFLSPFAEIRKNKHYLESHSNKINAHFIEDGSGKILHEQLKIKSLIWYPFAFDEHGYYVFTLNQILYQRPWTPDEITFLESASKQISLALMKIKLLEEKKSSIELLRVSEEKHRLITQMRQGVAVYEIILDRAGKPVDYRFLEVNSSYEMLTGLKRENIIGKALSEILPDTEWNQINKYGQVAISGEPFQYENYAKELGKYFEVVVYTPQFGQVAVIISDISERKRYIEALRVSEERYRLLAENIPDIIYSLDAEGNIITVNSPAFERYGYSEQDAKGKPFLNFIHLDDRQIVIESFVNALQEQRRFTHGLQFRIVANDGTDYLFELNSQAHFGCDGGYLGEEGILRDITERKRAENALKEEYNFRRAIENSMQAGVAVIDLVGKQISVNQHFSRMVGWTQEELIGKSSPFVYWPPDEIENINDAFQQTLQGKASEAGFELKFMRKNGELFDALVNLSGLEDSKHEIIGWLAVVADITERKQMEVALRRKQSMLVRTESIAQIGSWEWDVATDTVIWSDEMFRLFQRNPADGAPSFADHPGLYLPDDMQRLTQAVDAAISSGTPYEIELHTIRKDGAMRVCLARGFAEMSPEMRVTRLFGSLQDITERKLAEEKVQLLNVELGKLVVTDTLTQINNRRYFMQRGTEEILRENRSNQPLVLLMMDLDEFKKVNDSHGHAVGDLVLQQVARVLSSNVREIDILGRLGGEEFAVLSPNTSLKDAVILAERMRQSIENTPIVISGQSLMVTVSIGAAEFREEMTSISALLRNADAAMYQAKHSGRNCVRVFQDLLERPNPR